MAIEVVITAEGIKINEISRNKQDLTNLANMFGGKGMEWSRRKLVMFQRTLTKNRNLTARNVEELAKLFNKAVDMFYCEDIKVITTKGEFNPQNKLDINYNRNEECFEEWNITCESMIPEENTITFGIKCTSSLKGCMYSLSELTDDKFKEDCDIKAVFDSTKAYMVKEDYCDYATDEKRNAIVIYLP